MLPDKGPFESPPKGFPVLEAGKGLGKVFLVGIIGSLMADDFCDNLETYYFFAGFFLKASSSDSSDYSKRVFLLLAYLVAII